MGSKIWHNLPPARTMAGVHTNHWTAWALALTANVVLTPPGRAEEPRLRRPRPAAVEPLELELAPPPVQIEARFELRHAVSDQRVVLRMKGGQIEVEAMTVAAEPGEADDASDSEAGAGQRLTRTLVRPVGGNLDGVLFGQGITSARALESMTATLNRKIAAIDQACELTDSQKEKLVLAGRGDIQRFLDRTETARLKYRDGTVVDEGAVANWAVVVASETQPLRQTFQNGLFGDGSLFARTLNRQLTPQQAAEYAREIKVAPNPKARRFIETF